MAGETEITIVGNLTRDPEMRFLDGGDAVCRFAIASTPRIMDRQSSQWKDGDPLFMECVAWRDLAEHIAASIEHGFGRGARVVAHGVLKQRSYEKDGQKRTVIEMTVNEIGASLRYATVQVSKVSKGGNGGGRTRGDDEWESASTSRPADSGQPTQAQQATAQPAAATASADSGWD